MIDWGAVIGFSGEISLPLGQMKDHERRIERDRNLVCIYITMIYIYIYYRYLFTDIYIHTYRVRYCNIAWSAWCSTSADLWWCFLTFKFYLSSLKPFLISFGCNARPEVFDLASNHARSPRHRKHIAYRQRVRGDDQEWLCMDSYGWLLEAEEIWENAFGLKPLPSVLTLIDSDCRWLDISMLDWRWPLAVARQVAQTCSFTMRAIWWISVFTLCAQQRTVQFCHVLKLAVMSDLPKHPWTYRKPESIWAVLRFCEFRITFEHAVSFPTLIKTLLPMRLRMGWSVVAIWNQICLNFNKRAKMLMNLACTYLQNHFSLRLEMTWYEWWKLNFSGVWWKNRSTALDTEIFHFFPVSADGSFCFDYNFCA